MPQQPDGIENTFMTATKKFAGEIEKLVIDNHDMNYIDAVVHFYEMNSIELDTVNKLIPNPSKKN